MLSITTNVNKNTVTCFPKRRKIISYTYYPKSNDQTLNHAAFALFNRTICTIIHEILTD